MLLVTVRPGRPVQDLHHAVALHTRHQAGQQLTSDAFLFQMPRIRGSDVAAGRSRCYCIVSHVDALQYCGASDQNLGTS